MNKKVTGIVAYITIIGWIVAYVAGDKENAKFHLNQGLVVCLLGLANGFLGAIVGVICRFIPFLSILGWVVSAIGLVILAAMIIGIVYAVQEQDKEIPVIGSFKILK